MSTNIVDVIVHASFQLHGEYQSCWSFLKKWTNNDKYINKQVPFVIHVCLQNNVLNVKKKEITSLLITYKNMFSHIFELRFSYSG